MRINSFLGLTLGLLVGASSVVAQVPGRVQTISVFPNQTEFVGPNVVRLKQLLQSQRPNLNTANADLLEVIVIAKSRNGGTLQLIEGQMQSPAIPLIPRPIAYDRPLGFDTYRIIAPRSGAGSQGVWQLHTRGAMKIQRIDLTIQSRVGPSPIGQFEVVGRFKADKVIGNTEIITINRSNVDAVRLHTDRDVQVISAYARLADGRLEILNGLTGYLLAGELRIDRIRTRGLDSYVSSLVFQVNAVNLIGGRPEIEVSISR